MPKMTFILKDGSRKEVEAPLGLSVLEIAHRNHVDIEGACEGSLACSTCHVIVDPEDIAMLPKASEEEDDLLDLAPHAGRTSRLAFQIILTECLESLSVRIPPSSKNWMGS